MFEPRGGERSAGRRAASQPADGQPADGQPATGQPATGQPSHGDRLRRAVDDALGADPSTLPPGVALQRARDLLVQADRLHLAALRAVDDLDRRELCAFDGAASTRGWLRQQPCGDRGQLTMARQLHAHPVVAESVAAGVLGGRGAQVVGDALDRVAALDVRATARSDADGLGEDQLLGVVVDGAGSLLAPWAGAAVPLEALTEELRDRQDLVARTLHAAATDRLSAPADRLAPVFALVGRALGHHARPALQHLTDALEPERLDADADHLRQRCSVSLRRRFDGGWDLRALLDDATGELLAAALHARRRPGGASSAPADDDRAAGRDAAAEAGPAKEPNADAALETGPAAAGVAETSPGDTAPGQTAPGHTAPGQTPPGHTAPGDDAAVPGAAGVPETDPTADAPSGPEASSHDLDYGSMGVGVPPLPPPSWHRRPDPPPPVEGSRPTSAPRDLHDALRDLLLDLLIGPGASPAPVQLVVTAGVGTMTETPGAVPAQLHTSGGPVSLSPGSLAALRCGADLSAVLVDARGHPVGASGTHRNATDRQRRALRAIWGDLCAVNGCTATRTVPHHTPPWALSGRTRLADLVPLCDHHHLDLHLGHRTLRLRDGRLVDDAGWADALPVAA